MGNNGSVRNSLTLRETPSQSMWRAKRTLTSCGASSARDLALVISTTSVLTTQVENSQGTKLIKFWGDSVCYTTLLLAKAVCDRRIFISHPVGDQAHGTPPTPKQRLNRQILTPDSRSISWTLRTSEDETVRISTMTGSEPFRDVIVFFSSAYVCVLLQPHTSIYSARDA